MTVEQNETLRDGTPAEAGVRADRLDFVDDVARRWVESGETTGLVVGIARRGVTIFHRSYGVLTPDENSPAMPLDALFPVASISKPITATAVMCLVEGGLVGLHRAVQGYVPEFAGPDREQITVEQLLTHTSGLRDEHIEQFDVPRSGISAVTAYLDAAYTMPVRSEPGSVMTYCDTGYELLGEIVRRVAGQPLETFAHQRIFAPLGLVDSFYVVPEEARHRIARRYPPGGDTNGSPYCSEYETRAFETTPWASSGMFSTARDLLIFGQMFLQKGSYGGARILGPASVSAMTRNQIPGLPLQFDDEIWPEASWGYGWHIHGNTRGRRGPLLYSPRTFEHVGMGGSFLWVDPEHQVVGTCLSLLRQGSLGVYPAWRTDLLVNSFMAAIVD
jgi:CubicO group peptidase (beta-lactamase class C family)